MKAQAGDRVLVQAQIIGFPPRPGVVIEALECHVQVKFDDGSAPLWCSWDEVEKA